MRSHVAPRAAPIALLTLLASLGAAQPRLLVWPLDTAGVTVGEGVDLAVFVNGKSARATREKLAPKSLVAARFFPAFGDAVAHAARDVHVADSSAAARVTPEDHAAADYMLVVRPLEISQESRTVARRSRAPEPPGFDPATGEMTPGTRWPISEGPGLMTTLTARAGWVLWDRAADTALAHGTAKGASSFRDEVGKAHWNEAARELAKDLLYQTRFAPPR
jgi:hypothetical protein